MIIILLFRYLACELAEYIGIIQPIDLPVEINRLNVIIESDDDEISIPNKSNNENKLDALENDDANVSMAIQHSVQTRIDNG
ncbi:unnamed protein product [Rhizophagus irregularis]|nr:unnamed protein product [Rhizophagus irregularis]